MKTLALFLALTLSAFAADTPLTFSLQSRTPSGRATQVKESWLPSINGMWLLMWMSVCWFAYC